MERYTGKTEQGYQIRNMKTMDDAVTRLGRLEDMYEALQAELSNTTSQLQQLSVQGKTKSATYRQLFGNKLTLQGLISRFEIYGM